MTTRAFEIGEVALVRGRVHVARAQSAIVDLPTLKYGTAPFEFALSDLFAPPQTDGAGLAAAELIARLDALGPLAQRLLAEVYELGGHAAAPSRR